MHVHMVVCIPHVIIVLLNPMIITTIIDQNVVAMQVTEKVYLHNIVVYI